MVSERPLLLEQALRKVHGRGYAAKASKVTGVRADLITAWVAASTEPQEGTAEVMTLNRPRRS